MPFGIFFGPLSSISDIFYHNNVFKEGFVLLKKNLFFIIKPLSRPFSFLIITLFLFACSATSAQLRNKPVDTSKVYKGNSDAPITIVEYADFQCPYCRKFSKEIAKLIKWRPGKIRFIFKNNPLSFHEYAHGAAEAWFAAAEEGKQWEMYDLLLAEPERLDRKALIEYAKKLGLNEENFKKAIDQKLYAKKIEAEQKEGEKKGVVSVPTLFINDVKLRGFHNFDELKRVVLKELGEPVPEKLKPLPKVMTTTGEDINMRLGPGFHYAVIWHILKKAKVEVIARSDKWIEVKYQNFQGWVHKSLLK